MNIRVRRKAVPFRAEKSTSNRYAVLKRLKLNLSTGIMTVLLVLAPFFGWLDVEIIPKGINFLGYTSILSSSLWELAEMHAGITVSSSLAEASLATSLLLLSAAVLGL